MTDLKDLNSEFQKIKGALDLPAKKKELAALEARATDPDFWDDPFQAKSAMQTLGDLKKEIETVETLEENLETLLELSKEGEEAGFAKEIEKAQRELEKLKITTYLSGKYDRKNAIVLIHAGQGGVEAMDWASMLLRMYLRFCEQKGWQAGVLDQTSGEEAGLKSVTFKASGLYAYGYLKGEGGTHRLVRQSPFNADKLRQTSFAMVEVLPEFEAVDLPDIEIKDEDLDWQFFHASSQGGQNVQKVSTAVRLTHRPTGLVVTAQAERFQEQNRKNALDLLRSKLWIKKQEEAKKEKQELKGGYTPATWGTQIRSYVLHPYKMVKDLRTGVETGNAESVLNGEIEEFIEAELRELK
jgi:peptide chain release factor 2